ncbi:hypothetical protein ACFL7D_00785 [candidate division KSB1 bacterium]
MTKLNKRASQCTKPLKVILKTFKEKDRKSTDNTFAAFSGSERQKEFVSIAADIWARNCRDLQK